MKKASRLQKACEAHELRAYEIAEKLGMSVVRYISIERAWEEPNEEEIRKICQFFGMSPQALGFSSGSLNVPQSDEIDRNA